MKVSDALHICTHSFALWLQAPDFVGNAIHTGWLDSRIAAQVCHMLLALVACKHCTPALFGTCIWSTKHPPRALNKACAALERRNGLLPPVRRQVRAEKPAWHLAVAAGAVLRTLGHVSSRVADYLAFLTKGQLPPTRISLTSFQEALVLDGAPHSLFRRSHRSVAPPPCIGEIDNGRGDGAHTVEIPRNMQRVSLLLQRGLLQEPRC